MNKLFGVLIMIFSIFSCFNNSTNLKINMSEGFVDIDLSISNITKIKNTFIIDVNSIYKKDDVGFQIEIENVWKKNQIGDTIEYFYWGKGNFINSGNNYNNFVKLLSELYKVENEVVQATKIPIVIVGLGNDPSKLLTNTTKMKIFFNSDSENEDLYSEIFLNINFKKKIIQFKEKDLEYRSPLVKSLSGLTN